MRVILLIMIGLSVALMAELTRDATAGVVTDSTTGLEWQDNEVGITTDWQGAIDRCEELTLGTHSDWRLPNVNELKSIVDRGKVEPAIKDGFEHTSSSDYWSSTTNEGSKNRAWSVIFHSGYVRGNNDKVPDHFPGSYVRCVRAGK